MSTGRLGAGDTAIQPTIFDAKADLLTATAADTPARLAVGSNDTVLTADSSTATGLKWAAVAGGANWSLLNSGGTALTGATRITVSGISGKDKILILINDGSASNGAGIMLELNGVTSGSLYHTYGTQILSSNTYASGNYPAFYTNGDNIHLANQSNNTDGKVFGYTILTGCNSSGVKQYQANNGSTKGSGIDPITFNTGGFFNSSSTISSITLYSTNGNFDNGTVYVYTSA